MRARYRDEDWLTSFSVLATSNQNIDEFSDLLDQPIPSPWNELLSADSIECNGPKEEESIGLKYPFELLDSVERSSSMMHHCVHRKRRFLDTILRSVSIGEGHDKGTHYLDK